MRFDYECFETAAFGISFMATSIVIDFCYFQVMIIWGD